ncbi:MAG: twin-arginine translocation signal domain-containing protein [Actinomycetota bacterium]|nr:twin-arginine translocation signal domain-containing protein [Acidimicrobiia bacterium]MDQ3294735.1 twin-arginine translocation signal domain-containing protein [Actinomycetota bacterium]
MTLALSPSDDSLPFTARLVHRLSARAAERGSSTRRGFLARAAIVGAAVATNPVRYLLRPGTAYAQVTGCGDGNGCGTGWTVFCVTVAGNRGKNTCPPGSFAAGWWKADNSAYCKGRARYYIDCNRLPSQPGSCGCVSCYSQPGSCDQRRYCCNNFRYGQCHQEIAGVTPVVCRIITCTPPWQWDPRCTTSSRTDNRTAFHTAPELAPMGASDISIKYQDLGLLGSRLGRSTTSEYDAAGGGRRTDFEQGTIFFRAAEGAHEVLTPIRDAWATYGGPAGFLGYPVSDSVPVADGLRNDFAGGGSIGWSAVTRAHLVLGAIRAHWLSLGAAAGPLGYPMSEEEAAPRDGRQSRFQNGTITWRPDLAAHAVSGVIHQRWQALGGAAGVLGYPLTDELGTGDTRGRVSWFEAGGIFATATTGAHDVQNPTLSAWYRYGGPTGTLGYPGADSVALPEGGQWTRFERGSVVSRPDIGDRVVRGAVHVKYLELGGPTGALGVPVTDEAGTGDRRGQVSWFQSGAIFWTAATGAHEVHNPILTEWYRRGGPTGPLGYPVADTERPLGAEVSRFERGTITYDILTGGFS